MAILLAFGYKASSGKDTSADYLENVHGWYKTAFAENLKQCLACVFGFTEYQLYSTGGKEALLKHPIVYTPEIHKVVVEWMEESLHVKVENTFSSSLYGTTLETSRATLQFIGTSVLRGLVPDYHIRCCLRQIPKNHNAVISDVRFPDEGQAVIDSGGFCIEILRDINFLDTKYANHRSEEAMRGWGGWFSTISNNSSFDDLYKYIDKNVGEIKNVSR